MNVSVVICSVNRPVILHDTVASIAGQTHMPIEILIVVPAKQHVLEETLAIPGVRLVLGALGLPAQRNAGLDQINPKCDLLVFFDDDIELTASYIEEMVALFSGNQQIVISSGRLLHDGGRGAIINREEARVLCEHYEQSRPESSDARYISSNSAYGCNMVVHYATAKNVRFDEGLPLYAWLEDRDYSHRLTNGLHAPVEFNSAVAVHLGSRSGRIGGVRMGFSEIVNPIYLWIKNRTFSIPYIVIQYWLRCLAGNVLGVLGRDPEYDRIGLLKGNLLGFLHLLSGHCDPSHITKLPANANFQPRETSATASQATQVAS